MLTRAQMEQAIQDGGSVVVNGQILSRIDDLPSEADLAQGDAAKEQAARAALDQQIARLLSERAKLSQEAQPQEAQSQPEAQNQAQEQDAQPAPVARRGRAVPTELKDETP